MSIQLDARPTLTSKSNSLFRSAYSVPISHPYSSTLPSRTRQEFKDEADINVIMRRYQSTGELPQLNLSAPQYLDVSGIDFQEQMNFVAGAKTMFMELPSSIRSRFNHDPASFVAFCGDESNRSELARMGLLSPEATRAILSPPAPATPSAPVPITSPTPSESA